MNKSAKFSNYAVEAVRAAIELQKMNLADLRDERTKLLSDLAEVEREMVVRESTLRALNEDLKTMRP